MKLIGVWIFLALLSSLLCAEELSLPDFEQRNFELTNQQRTEHGLQPLLYEAGLANLAKQHSRNMGYEDFFDHKDKEGFHVIDRQKKYYPELLHAGIGENLYFLERSDRRYDPSQIVDGWMASPAHRENVLQADYTHMGIGIFLIGDKLYTTQVLAIPILKLLSVLPDKLYKDKAYRVEFEYLSPQPKSDFYCMLSTPDPSIQVVVDDSLYYEGLIPLTLNWKDARHFSAVLRFGYGRGSYSLQMGWGEYYYVDLFKFRVH